MPFDPIAFETALVDIETHLGYLRGNEVAWEYLQQYPVDFHVPEGFPDDGEGVVTGPVWLDDGYRFPCPESQYTVTPQSPILVYAQSAEGMPFDHDGFVKEVQANIDQAWANGEAWSSGVAAYARSVCDPFTRVDVPALSEEIRLMQTGVVDEILLNESNDNWAQIGSMYTQWSGDHATAFQNFYDNYNDVEARYGRYLSEITTGFAMFAGLAAGTQVAAQKFVDVLLEGIKLQLQAWVAERGRPSAPSDLPAWVGDIPAVAETLLGLATFLPVVGPAAKGGKSAVSGAKQVYALLDRFTSAEDVPQAGKDFPIQTAEQIYSGLTDTLHQDYLTAYQDALDSLDSGASSGAVDGGNLEAQTFSAQQLVQAMKDADTGWEVPVDPGSLVGAGDDY
jgi:hypothetical protein